MINLRELMVFRAVMAAGTTTGASRALNLSQPSISRLLADLEARLRVSLFRRDRGRLVPTQDAKLLLEEVGRAFQSLDALSEYTGRLSRAVTRPIRLIVSPGLSYRLAPKAIALFSETYPNVPVFIDMRTTDAACDLVAADQADLAVCLLPANHPGVRLEPLIDVPIVCLMRSDHRLASRRLLGPRDLADTPVIMISRRYPSRIEIEDAFASAGIEARIKIESGSAAASCGSAQAGIGVALVNALMAREFETGELLIRAFDPAIRNSFGFLLPRGSPSQTSLALMQCIKAVAADQVGAHVIRATAGAREKQGKAGAQAGKLRRKTLRAAGRSR